MNARVRHKKRPMRRRERLARELIGDLLFDEVDAIVGKCRPRLTSLTSADLPGPNGHELWRYLRLFRFERRDMGDGPAAWLCLGTAWFPIKDKLTRILWCFQDGEDPIDALRRKQEERKQNRPCESKMNPTGAEREGGESN